jgi:hypothetical protein
MRDFDIVISYRREDSQPTSHAIYRDLKAHFGPGRILFDISDIPPGADYDQFALNAIRRAKVVIVVIGEKWLSVEKNGVRRLDSVDDPVRAEINAALEAQVSLIPVLVQEAHAPDVSQLPRELSALARLNMLPISERHWGSGMSDLLNRLTSLDVRPSPVFENERTTRRTRRRLWQVTSTLPLLLMIATVTWYRYSSDNQTAEWTKAWLSISELDTLPMTRVRQPGGTYTQHTNREQLLNVLTRVDLKMDRNISARRDALIERVHALPDTKGYVRAGAQYDVLLTAEALDELAALRREIRNSAIERGANVAQPVRE